MDHEVERRFEQIDRRFERVEQRLQPIEKHDEEFVHMFYDTCDLKSKEISRAREEAIKVSTDFARSNHMQTLWLIAGMFGLFISAVAYVGLLSNGITAAHTDIENVKHTIDRMDTKLDQIISKGR